MLKLYFPQYQLQLCSFPNTLY